MAPLDSNKLGLFYSHADQLNKEIFNHVGDVALDDFVGDPDSCRIALSQCGLRAGTLS